jgi:MFS family permease
MMAFRPLAGNACQREHSEVNKRLDVTSEDAARHTVRSAAPIDAQVWLRAGLAVAAIGWGAQQFTPLLLLYQARLDLSPTIVQATFGLYVLGLIPGLLLGGPVSDRYGRRRVMVPTLIASAIGTALLILGGSGVGWLFVGRLVSGVASGAGFSSGAAWIKELSAASSPADAKQGPRRLTVAMGIGFSLGPLVAGILAQWAPAPTVVPYLPHLALAAVAALMAVGTPETRISNSQSSLLRHLRIAEVRERRFLTVVVPLAPWVFGSVAIAVAYLPGLVRSHIAGHALIFSALIVVLNATAGIFVQPFARRVDHPDKPRLLAAAMGIVVFGILLAAVAAATVQPVLVAVDAVVLGAGYGCCQVYGLLEVQRMARPDHLGGLTAAYQAVSYVGLAASVPLAAASRTISPAVLLVGVAVLAALTLAWTTRMAVRTGPGAGRETWSAGAPAP